LVSLAKAIVALCQSARRLLAPMKLDVAEVESQIRAMPQDKLEQVVRIPGIHARIDATCSLTAKQLEAEDILDSDATHCMLFGGTRSGKTFIILRKIIARALHCESRHAVLRFRFNHVVSSVVVDTLPKVMHLCFPGVVDQCKLDKSLWYYKFPNGSEIWFGGLDEKERTEKILGQEYSTMFLNECSQIPLDSRDIAITRLAQNAGLSRKMFYDCNPPSKRHWTHLLFIDKIDPARHQPLTNPNNYASLQINPTHNRANLSEDYLAELENLDERKRRRFLLGVFSDDDETALWTPELLDKGRILDGSLPEMQRVVVAVDPSGCSGPEDFRSDEVGIVVVGLGEDGRGYMLEDLSGRFGPNRWKEIVASAYDRYGADAVVGETNYGGAMVGEVIRTATTLGNLPLAYREVTASRGKHVRAEPIAALFEQGKVSLVGRFEELEHQLLGMTLSGWTGQRSPDRADAMIWGLTALFPAMAKGHVPRRTPRIIHEPPAGTPSLGRINRAPRVLHKAL
jgi:phage terminase large subunit-like protein